MTFIETAAVSFELQTENLYIYVLYIYYFKDVPASAQNQFAWHPSGELHMSMIAGGSVSLDTRLEYYNFLMHQCFFGMYHFFYFYCRAHKDTSQDDVEVMSTDSSSSSSSDSQ